MIDTQISEAQISEAQSSVAQITPRNALQLYRLLNTGHNKTIMDCADALPHDLPGRLKFLRDQLIRGAGQYNTEDKSLSTILFLFHEDGRATTLPRFIERLLPVIEQISTVSTIIRSNTPLHYISDNTVDEIDISEQGAFVYHMTYMGEWQKPEEDDDA